MHIETTMLTSITSWCCVEFVTIHWRSTLPFIDKCVAAVLVSFCNYVLNVDFLLSTDSRLKSQILTLSLGLCPRRNPCVPLQNFSYCSLLRNLFQRWWTLKGNLLTVAAYQLKGCAGKKGDVYEPLIRSNYVLFRVPLDFLERSDEKVSCFDISYVPD